MTQLTTLTREQVRAVLLGLAEHSSGTRADDARADAVGALADALTTTRPVDPDLQQLRVLLARALGRGEALDVPTDGELLTTAAQLRASLSSQAEVHRDTLTRLLDLDPWTSDEDLADAVTEAIAIRQAASHDNGDQATAAHAEQLSQMLRGMARRASEQRRWLRAAEKERPR